MNNSLEIAWLYVNIALWGGGIFVLLETTKILS